MSGTEGEALLSVGIDVGTTTTQLMLSRLVLCNRAGPFSIPRIEIGAREILYRGEIHLTPLLDPATIDAQGVRDIVAREYARSGCDKSQVQTGAVIITGETARKENARQVLQSLSGFAGDFVVATAGPDLESILAARGAGAEEYARAHPCTTLLHMDIGGGTSNLALYRRGDLAATGCLDVGGRLLQVDSQGRISQMTDGLARLVPSLTPGQPATPEGLEPVLRLLTGARAWAAGLEKGDWPWGRLISAGTDWTPPEDVQALSFSGGVADCVFAPPEQPLAYGDLGVLLGRAIAASPALNALPWVRGRETIRATVVGAGAHSTQVSGSTIFYRQVPFPLKNLPVLSIDGAGPEEIRRRLDWFADREGLTQVALSLTGWPAASWQQGQRTARTIAQGAAPLWEQGLWPVVAVEQDMAKALGCALAPLVDGPLLCLDGICARQGDYLDVGPPAAGGAVLPVVVKTLAFEGP